MGAFRPCFTLLGPFFTAKSHFLRVKTAYPVSVFRRRHGFKCAADGWQCQRISNLRRKHRPTCAQADESLWKLKGKRRKKTRVMFTSTCCMLSSTLWSAAMCLTLALSCVPMRTQVNKVLLFPSSAHKSAGLRLHPLFVVLHALRYPDDDNHSAYRLNDG